MALLLLRVQRALPVAQRPPTTHGVAQQGREEPQLHVVFKGLRQGGRPEEAYAQNPWTTSTYLYTVV